VTLTRLAQRTAASVPARESLAGAARNGGTLALFLSAGRPEALVAELLAEGSAYGPDTPVVIGYRVSWPDEVVSRSTLGTLAADLAALGQRTSVMILVGDALADAEVAAASHVYSPAYGHAFRAAR
jgi:precorrin-4 methylase